MTGLARGGSAAHRSLGITGRSRRPTVWLLAGCANTATENAFRTARGTAAASAGDMRYGLNPKTAPLNP